MNPIGRYRSGCAENLGRPGFRRGFTLLEVLVALAIIAIALVAVIRTQGQGLRMEEEARFTARAQLLAGLLLAEVERRTDLGPGIEEGGFDEPDDDLVWVRETVPVPGLPGLLEVQARVIRKGEPASSGLVLRGFVAGSGQ